jgi:hypothetical protein
MTYQNDLLFLFKLRLQGGDPDLLLTQYICGRFECGQYLTNPGEVHGYSNRVYYQIHLEAIVVLT